MVKINKSIILNFIQLIGSSSKNNICNTILVKTENKKVKISYFNGENMITFCDDINSDETTSLLIDKTLFLSLAKAPQDYIDFTKTDTELTIKSGGYRVKTLLLDESTFPTDKECVLTDKINLNFDNLKSKLNEVSKSISLDEFRVVLTGVYLEVLEDRINFITLDGYRLSFASIKNTNTFKGTIIIPKDVLKILSKIKSKETDSIDISFNKSKMIFSVNGFTISSPLIEGDFVNYRSLIKCSPTTTFKVDSSLLLSTLDRVTAINDGNIVKFEINATEKSLTLENKSSVAQMQEKFDLISCTGQDVSIYFNKNYIKDALDTERNSEIIFKLTTAVSPVFMRKDELDDYDYLKLVLPVRVVK